MTFSALVEKAKRYARAHPQTVELSWIDNSTRKYDVSKAVCLCETRRIAACLMGAEAPDKALEDLLNALIDFDDLKE